MRVFDGMSSMQPNLISSTNLGYWVIWGFLYLMNARKYPLKQKNLTSENNPYQKSVFLLFYIIVDKVRGFWVISALQISLQFVHKEWDLDNL